MSNQRVTIVPEPYEVLATECDGCDEIIMLRTTDADGILIGDECPWCGYYTSRYQRGMGV